MRKILSTIVLLLSISGTQTLASSESVDPIPKGSIMTVMKTILGAACPKVLHTIVDGQDMTRIVYTNAFLVHGKLSCKQPFIYNWCRVSNSLRDVKGGWKFQVMSTETSTNYTMNLLRISPMYPSPGWVKKYDIHLTCQGPGSRPITSLEAIQDHLGDYIQIALGQE